MKTLIATAAAVFFAFPVNAQPACAAAEDVEDILFGNYGETRVSTSFSVRGYIFEMWANLETGSWTAVGISAEGVACVLDQGEGFRAFPMGEPA